MEGQADLVVVGSGAAGLTAAITAAIHGCRVIVIEKADAIGGTTAWSGGAAWLPGNAHMAGAGIADSVAAAETYLREIIGNRYDAEIAGAFLDAAPRMLAFLEAGTSAVRFQSFASPDYHPDLPGAATKARTVLPLPFDGRLLGPWLGRLRPPMPELTVFGGMQVDAGEALHLQYAWKSGASSRIAARLIGRYVVDRLRFGRGTRLIRGQALVARLLYSALDLGVGIRTGVTALRLVAIRGRVTGLVVATERGEETIAAGRGVVLASGGFSANAEMVGRHIGDTATHVVMLPETNRGEGLAMAADAGGVLRGDNADNGIWMPASTRRRRDGSLARYPHFAFDRCKPGAIIVDAAGRRFVNEAASYHLVVRAMRERAAIPAWLIADHVFLRRYGMGMARPFPYPYRHLVREGYLVEARTLDELARRIGVDPVGLAASAAAMNAFAARGIDEDFGKGGDIYTRALGDAGHGPNPCLGPIATPPYYALALYPSDCGTVLGLATDRHGRVLRGDGSAIDGLYACGLDMNSVMHGHYPGAGTHIGPAMTFAYLAGCHAAGVED